MAVGLLGALLTLSGCANDPPVADFTLSPNPTTGQTVTFDGSASHGGRDEADQPIGVSQWQWDLDGNGSFERATTGPTVRHTYDAEGTVEVGLRVISSRGAASPPITRTVITTERETAAAPAGTDCDLGEHDHHSCGSQRLDGSPLGSAVEPTVAGPQPDWSLRPVFNSFFGGGFTGDQFGQDRVGVAVGADRVFVLQHTGDVRTFDATSMADLGSFYAINRARDIAFYRGEVYVLAADGDVAVFTPEGSPQRVLRMVHHGAATTLLEQATSWSLTVAWGEVWSTLSLGTKRGQAFLARDAKTGTFKSVAVHYAESGCTLVLPDTDDTTERCFDDTLVDLENPEPVEYWRTNWVPGVSAVPELSALIAECRALKRSNVGGLTFGLSSGNPDAVDGGSWCDRGISGTVMGTDSVWGRSHFLQVSEHAENNLEVNEYRVTPTSDGNLHLVPVRDWSPRDLDGWRDIAYRTRDTRIDWSGPLTKQPSDWLRSPSGENQCLHYVVSDADIFVVGRRGERWYELAQGLNRVDLVVGGVVRKTSTAPEGDFCLDTRTISNGTHRLELKAYLSNPTREVGALNEQLRVDNEATSGRLVEAQDLARGTVTYAGVAYDPHSGVRNWALEIQRPGSGSWEQVCDDGDRDERERFACPWSTTAYPDGNYRVRARMTDHATDGGNVSHTAAIEVEVDNVSEWEQGDTDAAWDQAQGYSNEQPETDFEPGLPDPNPLEWADGDGAHQKAYAQCAEDDPYVNDLVPDYVEDPTIRAGQPDPRAALADFMKMEGVPVLPLPAFEEIERTANYALYQAFENGYPRAIVEVVYTPALDWVVSHLQSCSNYPVPVGTITNALP